MGKVKIIENPEIQQKIYEACYTYFKKLPKEKLIEVEKLINKIID